jgi:hypothetical protein
MQRTMVTMFGAVGLLVTMSGSVDAQESFGDLQSALTAGDVVSVTDDGGRQTRGTVTSVGTSLRVAADGVDREFLPQQVREIRRRGDSLRNGLLIGLISGGAAGAVMGWGVGTIFEAEGSDPAGPFIALLAVGLGAGAGIGVGLDAAITGSTVVYRRQARTVSVAPMIGPRSRGVRVGVAF